MAKVLSWVLVALMVPLVLSGCGKRTSAQRSACDGLLYKEYGLTAEEYLPCAGEILSVMDELTPLIQAGLEGDKESRKKARQIFRQLRGLFKKAGGRNLLEGWEDQQLNNLNVSLYNAYIGYTSSILAPNEQDFQNAQRNLNEARMLYDTLA